MSNSYRVTQLSFAWDYIEGLKFIPDIVFTPILEGYLIFFLRVI